MENSMGKKPICYMPNLMVVIPAEYLSNKIKQYPCIIFNQEKASP